MSWKISATKYLTLQISTWRKPQKTQHCSARKQDCTAQPPLPQVGNIIVQLILLKDITIYILYEAFQPFTFFLPCLVKKHLKVYFGGRNNRLKFFLHGVVFSQVTLFCQGYSKTTHLEYYSGRSRRDGWILYKLRNRITRFATLYCTFYCVCQVKIKMQVK